MLRLMFLIELVLQKPFKQLKGFRFLYALVAIILVLKSNKNLVHRLE